MHDLAPFVQEPVIPLVIVEVRQYFDNMSIYITISKTYLFHWY